jgi:hypothetical protein
LSRSDAPSMKDGFLELVGRSVTVGGGLVFRPETLPPSLVLRLCSLVNWYYSPKYHQHCFRHHRKSGHFGQGLQLRYQFLEVCK